MDLQHSPYTPLVVLAFLVVAPLVVHALFGTRSVIDEQRELAIRRANWKGTNGPAARRAEVARVHGNRAGLALFAGALVVSTLWLLAAR